MSCPRKWIQKGTNMDSDSYQIVIDNSCSDSIAKSQKYFTGPLVPCNINIQGLAGGCSVKRKGTWKFEIEDDTGITRTIKIPDTLYCTEAPYCLLSPQHWSQQCENPSGTYCKVGHEFIELIWQNSKLHRKVKINASNNCGIIWSVPGYSKHSKFMSLSGTVDNTNSTRNDRETPTQDITIKNDNSDMEPITPFNFESNHSSAHISDLEGRNNNIMQWHIRLNHLPFSNPQLMASMGMIPKRLSKISKDDMPICTSCVNGKATHRPWRNKRDHRHIKPSQDPGEYVSVDLFESSTKGIIGQIKGNLMQAIYTAATVFVDHYSSLSYVHMQRESNKCGAHESKSRIRKLRKGSWSYGEKLACRQWYVCRQCIH